MRTRGYLSGSPGALLWTLLWGWAAADAAPEAQWHWRARGQAADSGWLPLRLYQQLLVEDAGGWTLAALTEKDPGESSWRDLTAFYVDRTASAERWRLTLGDLAPGFAQGLVWGRRSTFGAAVWPRLRRDSQRLGRRAAIESGGVRGASMQRRGRRWHFTGLAGRGRWDGRLAGDAVEALRFDGLHASAAQRLGRGVLAAPVGGARLVYVADTWRLGTAWSGQRFDRRLDLRGGTVAFKGRWQVVGGIDGSWRRRGTALYGEAAFDPLRGYGATAGGRWSRRGTSVGGQLRRYTSGFYAFFAGAPGAGTNEEGAAFEFRRRRGLQRWHAFAAAHRRLRPLARRGSLLARAEWGATWRWDGSPVSHQVEGRQSVRRLRGTDERSLLFRWTGQWREGRRRATLRAAGRRVRVGATVEGGALVAGRLAWAGPAGGVGIHLSAFKVTAYASRLYEYEPDMPGGFGVAALYGRGWRLAVSSRFRFKETTASAGWRYERTERGVRRRLGLQVDMKNKDY